jgi:hypothetical protein
LQAHGKGWGNFENKRNRAPVQFKLQDSNFKKEVEKELTGRETEPWEIIYFKLYQSQMPVIDRAIETASLMLGSDRSRGYCLEMTCADFLAGANLTTEIRRRCCSR